MVENLLSLPIIPSLIISILITVVIFGFDQMENKNTDNYYYFKIFTISFISAISVLYFYNTYDQNLINKKVTNLLDDNIKQELKTVIKNDPNVISSLPDF